MLNSNDDALQPCPSIFVYTRTYRYELNSGFLKMLLAKKFRYWFLSERCNSTEKSLRVIIDLSVRRETPFCLKVFFNLASLPRCRYGLLKNIDAYWQILTRTIIIYTDVDRTACVYVKC